MSDDPEEPVFDDPEPWWADESKHYRSTDAGGLILAMLRVYRIAKYAAIRAVCHDILEFSARVLAI